MEKFFALVSMAILIESIVTYISEIKKQWQWELVIPIVLGVLVAVLYNIDLPQELGISAQTPLIGNILTGIIMARGSNYMYDVLGRLTNQGGNDGKL